MSDTITMHRTRIEDAIEALTDAAEALETAGRYVEAVEAMHAAAELADCINFSGAGELVQSAARLRMLAEEY